MEFVLDPVSNDASPHLAFSVLFFLSFLISPSCLWYSRTVIVPFTEADQILR